MRLVVVGVSHKTAPVSVRETVAVPSAAQRTFLQGLLGEANVDEAIVVSTCNRVEVYAVPSSEGADLRGPVCAALTVGRGLDAGLLDGHAYVRDGAEAVRHLLRVTASLDSMVVGEPQILGQVKEAVESARAAGTVGPVLDQLLQRAFKTAKAVRTQTAIARQRVSVGSVAVDLAKRIFNKLSEIKVVMVGAGEMGEATARSLASAGAARVYICNRSKERAFALAEKHGWRARGFDELEDLLAEVDVVITSTGATRPIIDVGIVKRAIRARKYRPLFLVDIAVPRDVDAKVGDLDTVYLYNVDDLQGISDGNLQQRQREADAAERLVEAELDEIDLWFKLLEVQPAITAIRDRAREVAMEEIDRTLSKRLSHLTASDRKSIEKMMQAAMSKLLHPTMMALRESATGSGGRNLVAQARLLYGVDDAAESAEDAGAGEDDHDHDHDHDDDEGASATVAAPGATEPEPNPKAPAAAGDETHQEEGAP